MVSRLIRRFTQESYSVHKAALLIAALSLVSQVLAIVRDKFLAHTFGAGEMLDVYYTAFRVPDLLYATLASMLAAIAFLPLFSQKNDESQEKGERFSHSVFTVFVFVASAIAIIFAISMPYLSRFLAPGFSNENLEQLIFLSRVLLLSPILLGVSNLIGSLLQSKNKILLYAFAPVAYNIGIIAGIIFAVPFFGISGIVYGVIFGACLHLLVQFPGLKIEGMSLRFAKKIDWPGVVELIRVATPRVATLGLMQVSQIYLIAIATTLAVGSVSVFTFAFNIQTVPLSLIGVSYSVAAFPVLVHMFQKRDTEGLWQSMVSVMRHILFWVIPIICFAIVLRAHIVRVLYGSGEFTWTDTRLTAAVFGLMILSLAAQSLSLLFMRALYAMRYVFLPLLAQVGSLLVTFTASWGGFLLWNNSLEFKFFFEALFRVQDVAGTSIMMVSLAYTVSAITLCGFLWLMLRRALPFARISSCRTVFIESLGASILGATVCYGVLSVLSPYISLDTFYGVAGHAVLGAASGGLAWFLILYILGSIELREFVHVAKKRFWKSDTKIVQNELQEL